MAAGPGPDPAGRPELDVARHPRDRRIARRPLRIDRAQEEAPVNEIVLRPIGVIHTPHREQAGTPIQPSYAQGVRGSVTLLDDYVEALADLDGFERIWLLYRFDRARGWRPRVVPFRDVVERGLFATRAPARPNPIGLSVVRLLAVAGATLEVEGVDMLDGTPLLDVKPYVPAFDSVPEARAGWLEGRLSALADVPAPKADDRFHRAR
jgi:tRNA-Thr(GGU) m(6)t(6)A37 methyltransferase TsaA